MAISVKNYTNRFIVIAILIVMAIWASLFYAVIMDEVYDNIDDGLKNQKILIIREVYKNPKLIDESHTYGINQFVIKAAGQNGSAIDANIFSKESIYMPYDEEEEPYRVLRTGFYDAEGKPYELSIRTSTVEEDDFLINLAISLLVLYVVLVLSILIINYFVLTKAWRPFNKILKNLAKYRFGDANSFVSVDSPVVEFNNLNKHIIDMIEQNEKVFDGQKRFIENASHELQTPLTVSINKLELLLQQSELSEDDTRKIVEAKRSLHRMVNLNKSLLMLSRIDNHQYAEVENVNINDLLRSLLEDYQDRLDYKELQLIVEENDVFIVDMNRSLVHILVSNLLNNAIKYNYNGGKLHISLHKNELSICNTSLEQALHPDYIFERFYKGTQDNNSNGLGLSIVKTIMDKYPQLQLKYSYEQEMQKFSLKNS